MANLSTYKELTANGTFTLKATAGHLVSIIVNLPGGGSMQVFDNTSAAAPAIMGGSAAIALPAAGSNLKYDCDFYTGLTIVISGMTSGSITVNFQ
jgi:hypothetical protein